MKKKYFYLLLFLLLRISLFGQIQDTVSIMNFSSSMFFELVPYTLKVNLNDSLNLIVKGDENCILTKNNKTTYTVIFQGNNRAKITVFDTTMAKIATKEFYFNELPLSPVFNSISSGHIIPKDILSQGNLRVGFIAYDIDCFHKVVSFQLVFNYKGKTLKTSIVGDKIDNENLILISKLPSGTPIIFDNIRYERNNLTETNKHPLVLYLK